MSALKKNSLFILILSLTANFSYTQYNVASGSTATKYVQELIGLGVSIIRNDFITSNSIQSIRKCVSASFINPNKDEEMILSTDKNNKLFLSLLFKHIYN